MWCQGLWLKWNLLSVFCLLLCTARAIANSGACARPTLVWHMHQFGHSKMLLSHKHICKYVDIFMNEEIYASTLRVPPGCSLHCICRVKPPKTWTLSCCHWKWVAFSNHTIVHVCACTVPLTSHSQTCQKIPFCPQNTRSSGERCS